MNTPNKVLMQEARVSLKDKWGLAVKTTLVYVAFSFITSFTVGIILGIGFQLNGYDTVPKSADFLGNFFHLVIIGAPLTYGVSLFFLWLSRNQEARMSQVFEGFQMWVHCAVVYLRMLVVVLLWSLLLIVPGIIAAYSYSQVFYILADNPTMSAKDIMRKSKEMMKGNKAKLFYLQCRFIGWLLLSLLTLGIGLLWLVPYMRVSFAKFYDDVKTV